MSYMNADTIHAIALRHGVPVPAEVVSATALLDAATKLRDDVRAETMPNLETLTAKTLTKTHAALVAWDNRDARLTAADTIVDQARQQVDVARLNTATSLEAPLAELFNQAAATFTAAYAELGGNTEPQNALLDPATADAYSRLRDSAMTLDSLHQARAALPFIIGKAHAFTTGFEEASRCLEVPTRAAFFDHRPKGSGIDYWAGALAHGYRIVWQNREAQEANSVALSSKAATHS